MRKDKTLLIVDDDRIVGEVLGLVLRDCGYRILTTTCPLRGLDLLGGNRVNAVISDHDMPQMQGLDLLSHVKQHHPHVGRILVSAELDRATLTHGVRTGVIQAFMRKPWQNHRLRRIVNHIVDKAEALPAQSGETLQRP